MIPTKDFLKLGCFLKSKDAVTEVFDFITIIGVLILSLSLIGLAGYPVLKNAQEARYIENTRQSFIVLAENINKIAVGQAPSKSLEMKMYGGTLSVTNDGNIKINATNSTNQEITLYSGDMGNIQNSIGDVIVAYEGSGVWVKYPSGKILNVYKPLIANQSNILVIPVVRISGLSSIGGTGISRIIAEGESGADFNSNMSNITITITGNYTTGWEDYFRNMKEMSWELGTGYTARLNTSKNLDVYILKTIVFTEIE